ncbi:MAG: hypothetical protein CYPHOPRED_004671 [Cyphobasidiales sp. Tagirdzhanova-0007]|nr:MAG: hypothetical protein CYPHOPRED_004671 [Cyphobasidiales sp. Tagirdzhanova-0007]
MAPSIPTGILLAVQDRLARWFTAGADRFTSRYQLLRAASTAIAMADEDDDAADEDWEVRKQPDGPSSFVVAHPVSAISAFLGCGWAVGLFYVYPFPTTIPLFIGAAISLSLWVIVQLLNMARSAIARKPIVAEWSRERRLAVAMGTLLLMWFGVAGFVPPRRDLPVLHPSRPDVAEKYFIAANLYNSEAIFASWSSELLRLSSHLGDSNVFISVVESNSKDKTKKMLKHFAKTLQSRGIAHRLDMSDANAERWWPYSTSRERIFFLAGVRNKALEPIQSHDEAIRIPGHDTFTKIIFLNDIYFSYESIVRLLASRIDGDATLPGDYDLACAIDYGSSGLYDTWVARDVCGVPLRAFWPYVKDKPSQARLKQDLPFEVAACWNGAVAMSAELFLWNQNASSSVNKRGWRMMDDGSFILQLSITYQVAKNPYPSATYPGSDFSPPVSLPLQFRGPSSEACDHSECFLLSYDLHRLYRLQRRPRIYMNPTVQVAYEANWYRWHTTVLRVPVVRLWLDFWSRGPPLLLVDWIFEAFGRRRDYCTWAGFNIPERCPPLPGPAERGWGTG